MSYPVIEILGGLVVVVLVVIWVVLKKGQPIEPDYRLWFWIGAVWLPVFLILALVQDDSSYYGMVVLGLVMLVLGLKNRDKWGQRRRFADLPAAEKKLKLITLAISLTVLGILAYVFIFRLP